MKRLALIVTVAAAFGIWPAVSSAGNVTGVVVAKQRGTLLVAMPGGGIRSAGGSASIGSRVALSGGRASVIGRAHAAHIRGIVVRRVGTTVFLSSNRHLVAVRALSPAATTPQPGAIVSSQVTIRNGELEQEHAAIVGQAQANTLQVQAVVSAVAPGTVTLTVGTQTVTLSLPGGLTLPASLVGQTVTVSVSLDDRNANDDENDDDDHGGSGGHHGGHGGHDG